MAGWSFTILIRCLVCAKLSFRYNICSPWWCLTFFFQSMLRFCQKTKNINNLFGKPKKKVDIWKGSVHDVGLQPLDRCYSGFEISCLLTVVFFSGKCRTDHSSRGFIRSVRRQVCVIAKPRNGRPWAGKCGNAIVNKMQISIQWIFALVCLMVFHHILSNYIFTSIFHFTMSTVQVNVVP